MEKQALTKAEYNTRPPDVQAEYRAWSKARGKKFSDEVRKRAENADPEDEGWLGDLQDVTLGMAAGASWDWLDEGLEQIDKAAGTSWAKDYKKNLAVARKRSPYITTIGEILAPDPLTLLTGGLSKLAKIPKLIKLARAIKKSPVAAKAAFSAVATSAGMSDKKLADMDMNDGIGLIETGVIGSVIGHVGGKVTKGVSNKLHKGRIGLGLRKDVTGFTKGSEVGTKGFKEQQKAVNEFTQGLADEGFFKGVKTSTGLHQKAADIVTKGEDDLARLVKKSGNIRVSEAEARKLASSTEDFLKTIRHDTEFSGLTKAVQGHQDTLVSKAKSGKLTVEGLHDMKQRLYNKIKDSYGKEGSDAIMTATDKAVAKDINDLIIKKLPGEAAEKYGAINKKIGIHIKTKKGILKEVHKEFNPTSIFELPSEALKSAGRTIEPIASKGAEIASDIGQTGKLGETYARGKAKAPVEEAPTTPEEQPFAPEDPDAEDFRFDEPLPTLEEREPASIEPEMGEQPEMDPRLQMIQQRREEKEAEQAAALQDKIIATPLPRNTAEFLQNSEFAITKLAAQRPDIMAQWAEMLKNAPHLLEEHLMGLAQEDPMMLSHDPYNRINDRVIDNNMKQTLRTQIAQNPEMTNLQRVEKLDELNRTGIYKDSEPETEDQIQDTDVSQPPRSRHPDLGA